MDNQVELQHKEITNKILHAFYKIVYAQLGYGFLEKVYSNNRKTITWKIDRESVQIRACQRTI